MQGHLQQTEFFFLKVYSNTYALSSSFQIFTVVNPRFNTISDGKQLNSEKYLLKVRLTFGN